MGFITFVVRTFSHFGPLIVSILLLLFAALDIMHDIQHADGYDHIVFEVVVFFLGFMLNLFFVHKTARDVQVLQTTQKNLSEGLELSYQENSQLRDEQRKFKEGLNLAIEGQLKKWCLSPSEIEITFLLLKGLSNKEIAEIRQTSESTVRLQCSSIYKKSALGSRSELAAYFMEDML